MVFLSPADFTGIIVVPSQSLDCWLWSFGLSKIKLDCLGITMYKIGPRQVYENWDKYVGFKLPCSPEKLYVKFSSIITKNNNKDTLPEGNYKLKSARNTH